jgi:hypothetical protein
LSEEIFDKSLFPSLSELRGIIESSLLEFVTLISYKTFMNIIDKMFINIEINSENNI